ncbi:TPR-like protein, partial [Cylindrobasidium torrendii FP15055 ss-10]
GNSAFKSGDWATAVGHYSAAIIHDREDFTLPLNRAAAYLKLSKYDDADRDCTRVLELKPNNAKALFRRGQARHATGRLHEADEGAPSSPSTPKTPRTTLPHKMPANLFDLNKVWAMCETAEDRYHLISMIPPTQFPAFFQTSLEPPLLVSILQTFHDALERDASTQQRIIAYLDAFASVPRFGTLLLFLNSKEKETARALVGRLGGSNVLNPVWGKML